MNTQEAKQVIRMKCKASYRWLAMAGIAVQSTGLFLFAQAGSAPRNIVLLVADGCGYGQVASSDLFEFGNAGCQAYEAFPVRLAVSTYSLDTPGYDSDSAWADFKYVLLRPTDSAAAATAMSTGVKTRSGAIGTDSAGNPHENIVERCEAVGKATGVVTSVQFAHATPAGFAAHTPDRGKMTDIARSMILESRLEVIMGCGHPLFDGHGAAADSADAGVVGGDSVWTALRDGSAGTDADRDHVPDPWTFIDSREAFQKMAEGPTPKRVCGIARTHSTLQQNRQGDPKAVPFTVPFVETVPTLAEMTAAALNVLDEDPDGLFLMVEGGAVDWASHNGQTGRMIEEMADFNRAVRVVMDWVERSGGWEHSLVVVTGDHETGYPTSPRADSLWASTPLERRGELRLPLNRRAGTVPAIQWNTTGHTNALLPLFARGAGSEAFQKAAVRMDRVRGPFIDNTDIGKVLFGLNPVPDAENSP
jgi:alkaline phosphatase